MLGCMLQGGRAMSNCLPWDVWGGHLLHGELASANSGSLHYNGVSKISESLGNYVAIAISSEKLKSAGIYCDGHSSLLMGNTGLLPGLLTGQANGNSQNN